MKLVKPSYEILTQITGNELQRIELAARTCYKSEDKITDTSAQGMVKMLIKSGHEAAIEHSQLSVKFTCNRAVSHEIVRHRMSSFCQESQRYCNYTKDKFGNDITFIDISGSIPLDTKTSQLSTETLNTTYDLWIQSLKDAEKTYNNLIKAGVSPQIARNVLPNSVKTEIVMTANYREWRHFLKLRTAHDADPAMRELVIPLLNELKELIPVIFDDIEVK